MTCALLLLGYESRSKTTGKRGWGLLNPNDFHSFSKMQKYLTMDTINIHHIWTYNHAERWVWGNNIYTLLPLPLKTCFNIGNVEIIEFLWKLKSLKPYVCDTVHEEQIEKSSVLFLHSKYINKVHIWYKNPSTAIWIPLFLNALAKLETVNAYKYHK